MVKENTGMSLNQNYPANLLCISANSLSQKGLCSSSWNVNEWLKKKKIARYLCYVNVVVEVSPRLIQAWLSLKQKGHRTTAAYE